ncbi:MAG: hypothetical protein ACKVOQ_01950 [Cyclobacteriaceae bacterium]
MSTEALAKVGGLATRGDVATGLSATSSLGLPARGVHPERSRGRLFATIPGRGVPIQFIRTSYKQCIQPNINYEQTRKKFHYPIYLDHSLIM